MVLFGAAQVEYYCNKSLWLTSQVYFNSSYFLAFRRDFTQKPKNKNSLFGCDHATKDRRNGYPNSKAVIFVSFLCNFVALI
jgi:hypothetical protein